MFFLCLIQNFISFGTWSLACTRARAFSFFYAYFTFR